MKYTLIAGFLATSTVLVSAAQAEETITAIHAFLETLIYT